MPQEGSSKRPARRDFKETRAEMETDLDRVICSARDPISNRAQRLQKEAIAVLFFSLEVEL